MGFPIFLCFIGFPLTPFTGFRIGRSRLGFFINSSKRLNYSSATKLCLSLFFITNSCLENWWWLLLLLKFLISSGSVNFGWLVWSFWAFWIIRLLYYLSLVVSKSSFSSWSSEDASWSIDFIFNLSCTLSEVSLISYKYLTKVHSSRSR